MLAVNGGFGIDAACQQQSHLATVETSARGVREQRLVAAVRTGVAVAAMCSALRNGRAPITQSLHASLRITSHAHTDVVVARLRTGGSNVHDMLSMFSKAGTKVESSAGGVSHASKRRVIQLPSSMFREKE